MKVPVQKATDGFLVDEQYFDQFMFFYTTDPDAQLRFWQLVDASVNDKGGKYSLNVTGLMPGTRYYVKAGVLVAPHKQQHNYWSVSASVLEFETAK